LPAPRGGDLQRVHRHPGGAVPSDALYPKLAPGGFVIVDDFGVLPPCRKAVMDYRERMPIDAPVQEIDASGIWWQKEQSAARA
jgi:hypothetical protein